MRLLNKIVPAMTAAAVLLVSNVGPASAYMREAGDEPGSGLTVFQTILDFVIAPLAIMAVVTLIWAISGWRNESKPKTGDDWNPAPSSDVVNR